MLPKCTLVRRLTRHRSNLASLSVTSNYLISIDQTRNLIIWDSRFRVVHEIKNETFCVGQVPVCANEKVVAAQSGDHSILLLDPSNWSERRSLSAKNKSVNALDISDRYLLAGGYDCLEAWDLNSFAKVDRKSVV